MFHAVALDYKIQTEFSASVLASHSHLFLLHAEYLHFQLFPRFEGLNYSLSSFQIPEVKACFSAH